MCTGVIILLVVSVFINVILWWKLMDERLEACLDEKDQNIDKLHRIKMIIDENE